MNLSKTVCGLNWGKPIFLSPGREQIGNNGESNAVNIKYHLRFSIYDSWIIMFCTEATFFKFASPAYMKFMLFFYMLLTTFSISQASSKNYRKFGGCSSARLYFREFIRENPAFLNPRSFCSLAMLQWVLISWLDWYKWILEFRRDWVCL